MKKIKKSSKRLANSYANYKKMYRKKQKSMKRRGMEMYDTMLSKREYVTARKEIIQNAKDEGVEKVINVNQTLVSQQQYKYDLETGKRFLATAEEFGLEWDDKRLYQIRRGDIDVSGINDYLKEAQPEWTGKDRAKYISHEVFGSN